MVKAFEYLEKPAFIPPLDPDFYPAVLANRSYRRAVEKVGGEPLAIALERSDASISRYETRVFPEDHPLAIHNLYYVERLVKFLLWQRGGWKVTIGGSPAVGRYLQTCYSENGTRAFDARFMGGVYEQPFTVIPCSLQDVPQSNEKTRFSGRHLDGCRIGFDLGASDLKVSALQDGVAIFSQEIEWQPRQQNDPDYHRRHIREALQLAASKLPQVHAIGGSSAGIFVNNRPMVASLFRGIPAERFGEVRSMFIDLEQEMGVPLEVINDGDVTALAGAMSLEDGGVLGVAMGSSEAAGYVRTDARLTDWLNELAFAPVDYNPQAAVDEWSGDSGVGALYFSQQCVFRLAPRVGIETPAGVTDAQKLRLVQGKLEEGHEGALKIWQSMGRYLGYAVAHYGEFYDVRHVLILGRCTSGSGGQIILDEASQVLVAEFPDFARRVHIQLPDEKSRRVGQSIAAASLPEIRR